MAPKAGQLRLHIEKLATQTIFYVLRTSSMHGKAFSSCSLCPWSLLPLRCSMECQDSNHPHRLFSVSLIYPSAGMILCRGSVQVTLPRLCHATATTYWCKSNLEQGCHSSQVPKNQQTIYIFFIRLILMCPGSELNQWMNMFFLFCDHRLK
jgi:hypothetical protein